jgi:hypothetical protein
MVMRKNNISLKSFKVKRLKYVNHKIAFILAGILSTIWFLVRVIPKPQRANYPCMQAAAPIMSSFIIWSLSVLGMMATYRKAKMSFINSRFMYSGLFGLSFLFFLFIFIENNTWKISAILPATQMESNVVLGNAKGIFPGRVAWVHNPNAAKWTGTGNYWAASVNPQGEYDKMFTQGIQSLSGEIGDSASWNKIFIWFNNTHGRTDKGYQVGDKIAIKINQNSSASSAADPGNVSNANPQSCVACVRSLVNAGIPQADIWIGDPSRAVTDNIFNAIHSVYPDVNVVDYFGNNGRVTTTTVANVFPNNDVATGQSACFYNARYIINMPLLKGHVGQAITFGSKNFYGINGIKPNWQDNGGKHPGTSALTNYMTNANFGGKTVLWVMDATYPNENLDGTPAKSWSDAPFNGKPAASFFMSLDGVAEESVSLDFFNLHWASEISANGGLAAAEAYLINAANANAGVHEHWNNSTDKKYSRNLDSTANGIELVYIGLGNGISVSISSPTDNSSITSGSALNISGTSSKSGGTISKIEIYNGNSKIGTATGTTNWTYSWDNVLEGTYSIYAIATDDLGNSSISGTITIKSIVPTAIPGKIEAENWNNMFGVQTETTTDAGGGKNVGYFDANDWIDYVTNISTSGNYIVDFRISSNNANTQIQLLSGSTILTTLDISTATGGWQNWKTFTKTITFSTSGVKTIRLLAKTGGFNINWINFTLDAKTALNNNKSKNNIKLYYTSDGFAHLKMTDNSSNSKYLLEIFNNQGVLLVKRFFNNYSNDLYIGKLPTGVYIYKVNYLNNIESGKFMVTY